jgi:hypothetical protein
MKKKNVAKSTATGVATLQNTYYDRAALANLKTNTPFLRTYWVCACGQAATHEETITTKTSRVWKRRKHARQFSLCDACFFRYQVMKAANRLKEFIEAYDEHRKNTENVQTSPHTFSKTLPAPSGKSIQMFTYNPVTKP